MIKADKTLDGRHVLVTGGAGFLGSEVVTQLSELGARVTVLDNLSSGKTDYVEGLKNVILIVGDVCDQRSVEKVMDKKDFIVHMSALPFIPDSYYHPEEFFKTNVMGTINIVRHSMATGKIKNFVHVSSSEVYGTAKYTPMDEKHPTLPHSTYAVSKLSADRAVYTMHKEHGFPAVIIRPFNCYGPHVTQPYIVPEVAIQLVNGKDAIMLGNTETERDLCFVTDTARGIVAALISDNAAGETINLGSGTSIRIKDLLDQMARILGKSVEVKTDPSRFRPYDVQTLICDNRRALTLLDWQPQVSLHDGLKLTIDWIKKNKVLFTSPFRGWPSSYRETRNLLTH